MASASRLHAAVLLAAGLLPPAPSASGAPAAPGEAPPPPHKIAVEVRGPLVMAQVTRVLPLEGDTRDGGEALLDVALPEHAALIDVEIMDGGRFRAVEAVEAARGRDLYVDGVKERGLTAASEPFDDSTTFRIRVARAVAPGVRLANAAVTLRYRFSALADYADGRDRLRFPGAPERQPAPADVTVALSGAADVEIAGARTALGDGKARGNAQGHVSTRSGWEISWAPRLPDADAGPGLHAAAVATALSATESALAFAVHVRGEGAGAPPTSVLFLVDRSRSVGLPGLSAERDLVRRLLEALPPTTRFDALFFDRGVKRLFPTARPATREAMAALEGEMVPDQLQNGTDLGAALREAGGLLRREASTFGPHVLLAIVTDGALADDEDAGVLDRALGQLPALDASVAAFTVRVPDDDPVSPASRQALRGLAGARGGVVRELRTNEIDEAVPAVLAALGRGGDVASVRLVAPPQDRALADGLAPGQALAGVMRFPSKLPRALFTEGLVRGRVVRRPLKPQPVDAAWLRPLLAGAPTTRFLGSAATVALVEPVVRPDAPRETPVKGAMDRMVVRNALSLAYLPRARACYLGRVGATPALRDLAGRVRITIDLVRGEVARAKVETSTLNHREIESCLHDGAFAFEVPRAIHSDAPVTAVLNLVFRPSTPDKKRDAIEGAVGDQIDLIIEELHRGEQSASAGAAASPSPSPPPSPAPPAP